MAWRVPLGLQRCAARAVAIALVTVTELNIRHLLVNVPAEILIARATAELLLHENDNEDDDEECYEGTQCTNAPESEGPLQMDVMDHVMLQVKSAVEGVRQWWTDVLPDKKAGPGRCLEFAVEGYTEVHPRQDQDFPRHLTRLLLRTVLLQDVFLDRDYGDKDRWCVVPFAWERWTARLVAHLSPFPQMVHLRVYGGMYPSILAAVLRGASRLASLHISHINITDDILLVIAKRCPNLHALYLLHNFPWQVISMKAFCAAFFGGATHREVHRAYKTGTLRDIKRTFPRLQHVELAYGDIEVAKEFHKLLLAFYPDLKSVSCPWKASHFDDGYQSYAREVLLPLVSRELLLDIQSVFLDDKTLYGLSQEYLRQLAWYCPQVHAVTIDCILHGPERKSEIAGSRLKELKATWKHLSKLHVNVNSENHLTLILLLPFVRVYGAGLTAVTMEAASPGQVLHTSTLGIFLQACPNLIHLGVRVWSKNMIEVQVDEEGSLGIPHCSALQEFSLHEEGPGDADEAAAELRHTQCWLAVLREVVAAAPALCSLSLSVCRSLASILDKLACDVRKLHLHVKDGYEWEPTADQMCQLVTRLPQLHHLYLEEVSGHLFWRLRRRFKHNQLRLHWGNLYEWPRT